MGDKRHYNLMEMSAIREMANVGPGQATTALSMVIADIPDRLVTKLGVKEAA